MSADLLAAGGGLTVTPIGFVRSAAKTRIEAPRQPAAAAGRDGRIELLPGRNFEHALQDLDGWEYVWVLFWFHRNSGWRPKVLPPRSSSGRKGVFATRAPYRPNPIGLSVLRLGSIDGLTLHVSDVDMLDGTPVLDIKPYVPYTDAKPAARSGWLEMAGYQPVATRVSADPAGGWLVRFAEAAAGQAAWIEAHTGLPMYERIYSSLSMGPEPHPYRRIRRDGQGFCLAIKEWRVRFQVAERDVQVQAIGSGYRASQLAVPGNDTIDVHRAFLRAFPDSPFRG